MRRATPVPTGILIDLSSAASPLYQRIYESIRQAILTGELSPRTALPSTLGLAEELGVSRITVLQAYEMLISEGYLYGVAGSGTFVAEILPEEFLYVPSPNRSSVKPYVEARLSDRGSRMAEFAPFSPALRQPRRPFDATEYTTDLFPSDIWARLGARRYRLWKRDWLQYGEPAGYRPLREALAAYLRTARGVDCTTDQVMIFSGLASMTTFVAQTLTDPGDTVWVGGTTDIHVPAAFEMAGASVVHAPFDGDSDMGLSSNVPLSARLAYVFPSCNEPMGDVMSMARRLVLLQWAQDHSAWVIESDDSGEFRYQGRPLPSLQGLDQHGRTFYVATFNRVLFPSLRLAYVVVPKALVQQFVAARAVYDVHSPVFEQMVLADFISEGHFQRQIRRLRLAYAERQRVLVDAAKDQLAGLLDIQPRDSGVQIVGWLPPGSSEHAAVEAAARHDVVVEPLERLSY
jgi:GntR family transcriptional regulator/MocR family aminotransferase